MTTARFAVSKTAAPSDLTITVATIRHSARYAAGDGYTVLNELATALSGDRYGVVGVDLVAAYPPEVLLPDRDAALWHRLARFLGMVRDVLIFAPVAITWYYLWQALNSTGKPGESFLDGWRSGFGGEVTSLGSAALTVAKLVLAVAATTFLVHLLEWMAEARSSLARQRAQLGKALARATLVLARRSGSDEGEQVSMADIRKLVGQLEASTNTLVQELHRVSQTFDSGPNGAMTAALDKWSTAAAGLTAATASLRAPGEQLERFLTAQASMAAHEAAMRKAIEALVQQVQQATQASGIQAEEQGVVAERINDLMKDFGDRIREFLDFTLGMQRSIEQINEQLRQAPYGGGSFLNMPFQETEYLDDPRPSNGGAPHRTVDLGYDDPDFSGAR
ncbi:hypothetical protein Rhe02_89480 [Rhizocola hellebori]|uniref:Uncharacterized protein n=1 Tax=Rhizocola hellebori TaxID=1392758 RepID=A0A8J3QKQ0_9ACTN|nr:hypothetical protein [Rhizocola hellebori]GIH10881.1 hypothetical protein Rhe02_89480 [Rhizocola hellebori]